MSLSQNDVITVAVQTSAPAAAGRSFSTGLILGKSTVLPLSERVRAYEDIDGVGVDFAPTTEEYKKAAAWFGQKKASIVKIGRQFLAAQSGQLRGANVSGTLLSAFTAITAGGFDIAIDGVNEQVSGLNFSADTTMPQIATTIQTALAALVASTTCTWNAALGCFVITSPTTGTSSSIGYGAAPTHSGSPTDVSVLLGLASGTGAQAYAGIAIESQTAALAASAIFDPNFFGLTLAGGSTQDQKDAMAWTEAAGIYMFEFTVTDPAAKLSATTTDLGSFAQASGYGQSFGTWSGSAYAGVSALSRELLVDLTQPNSAIALFGKQLPGIPVDSITETERLALEAKNLNYYTPFAAPGATNGFAMYAQGKMADGTFIDQVFNLAWMQAQLQNAYFVAITSTPTKVAQTDKGMVRVKTALAKVMAQGVAAGIGAPGIYNGADIGEVTSGQFLKDGYYIFVAPVSTLSDADREARKAPAITIIMTGAGAVQKGSVVFAFQQ